LRRATTSATVWRSCVVVFATLAVVQLAIEAFNAPRVLRIGEAGETLFTGGFLRERGPTTFRVDALPAASPLVAAGVVPGDRLRYAAPLGRWYNLAAGERVALTVLHGDQSRSIDVTVPAAASLPRYQVANYVLDMAGRLVALLLGVWLGWRRPDLVAYRGLAAAGLTNAFLFPYSAPVQFHVTALDFVASVAQEGLIRKKANE